jgi:four helix bundle protein
MTNKEFSEKLEKRTKLFSIEIIKLSASLSNSPEARVIRNQITKSATSIGANYREANRSRSINDFKNKIKISESEANETLYWLEIIMELNWSEEELIDKLQSEAKELLAILTSIGIKMKTKSASSKET